MIVRTRFAPSPTGRLHLGHALAAKVAHDFARRDGGEFLLRHEDIDGSRVREEYFGEIEDDLRWLGLDWDGEPLRQTSRLAAYDDALDSLRRRGLVYPCFCTRRDIQQEIARSPSAPQGPEGPLYPGICRKIDTAARDRNLSEGLSHAWRLNAAAATALAGPLTFHDLRFGPTAVDPALLGDVVLARKDLGIAYHLAVVVDDAFQEITHVTRGEDLLLSTHIHRVLQALLDLPEPRYLHHPLVCDASGKRLAKRDDALSLRQLREDGATAVSLLEQVGGTFSVQSGKEKAAGFR